MVKGRGQDVCVVEMEGPDVVFAVWRGSLMMELSRSCEKSRCGREAQIGVSAALVSAKECSSSCSDALLTRSTT